MTQTRTFWYTTAAFCIAAAVLVFAGRTMLGEALDDGPYRAIVFSAYLLLAAAAGSLTRALSITREGPGT